VLSLIAAGIAAFLADRTLPSIGQFFRVFDERLAATALFAPAIVVSAVFESIPAGHRVAYRDGVSTLVRFAIFSVCLVVPLLLVADMSRQVLMQAGSRGEASESNQSIGSMIDSTTDPSGSSTQPQAQPRPGTNPQPTTRPINSASVPAIGSEESHFARALARLKPILKASLPVAPTTASTDVLVLLVAGLLMLPGSLGVWRLSRSEGAALLMLGVLLLLLSAMSVA
jgi:hypothetical protein